MKGIECAFTGRLGADAQLRTIHEDKRLCSFPMAVDEGNGPEWVRVTVWGKYAEELTPQLKTGTECYIEGTLRLSRWEDKDGNEKTTLAVNARKIDFLGQIGKRRPQEHPTPKEPSEDTTFRTGEAGAAKVEPFPGDSIHSKDDYC